MKTRKIVDSILGANRQHPTRRIIKESYDSPVMAVSATKSDDDLKRNFVQWNRHGNSFSPLGETDLLSELVPSAYYVKESMSGLIFERAKPKTDEMLVFENSNMDKVLKEIDKFWERKPAFEKLKLMHSRGMLIYGSPGMGKSICLQQVVDSMVKRGDIVLFCNSPRLITDALAAVRQIEPKRRIVVCLEEIDEICSYDERSILRLLDGDTKTDGVLYLATTNYRERLPQRILRPGRFDKHVHITPPTYEHRLTYLRHKMKDSGIEDPAIVEMAKKTDGFSFGHLRELIVSAVALGEPLEATITRLRESKHLTGQGASRILCG